MSICFNTDDDERKRHKDKETLTGTYNLQITVTSSGGVTLSTPGIVYGNITFHADGTLHGQDSNNEGQLGFFGTVWTGQWRKSRHNTFSFAFTSVFTSTATLATSGTTTPASRLGLTGTLTLSDKTLTGTFVGNNYALTDLTLSTVVSNFASGTLTGAKLYSSSSSSSSHSC